MANGQGAIEMASPTAVILHGQGATEYLVLLAVVLIVALVSVALLGFFPGMASDAQITQSQTYWKSAQPIAITEWGGLTNDPTYGLPYLRVRNNGAYPVRITKLLGPNGNYADQVYLAEFALWKNISDYYYIAPGEEKYFAWGFSTPAIRLIYFVTGDTATTGRIGGASSICNFNNSANPGTMVMNNFGFEYIEYLDNNQQITKREVGSKPLVIKCQPYP